MKAISIQNPYATQILRGVKTIEYRSWDTKHRGDLLICSSASPQRPGMLSGYALCVVTLEDTTFNGTEYEWHLSNVRKIEPFPVKGKLNFYYVDDALIHYVGEKTAAPKRVKQSVPESQPATPEIPGMPKVIDNINTRLKDDLADTVSKKSKLRIDRYNFLPC